MICKIQPPNPNIKSAIEYNERKMDGVEGIRPHETDPALEAIENGHILATRNVPEGKTLSDEFDRLKILNMRVRTRKAVENESFHMSVNPSADDRKMDDATAVMFIDELMASLGYGNQPYRIYKHTDIARQHYHVVSTRIGQDGRKINDSFERLTLRQKLKELASKYGYTVILNEKEEREAKKNSKEDNTEPIERTPGKEKVTQEDKKEKKKEQRKFVPPFDRKSETPVTEQMKDIFEDAMLWSFTTFEQLQALMLRRYNILLEIEKGEEESDRIVMAGTDRHGMPVTAPLSEDILGVEMDKRIKEKCKNTKMSQRREQRDRIEKLANAAAVSSASYDEFVKIMEKKGVYVVVSWTKDGEPFGVTWLDRATKCAWKGSETKRDIKWLKETAADKGWNIVPDGRLSILNRRREMPSRKSDIIIERNPAAGSGTGKDQPKRSIAGSLKGALSKAGRTQRSNAKAGGGRKDIFDEIAEEKRREEEAKAQREMDMD